MSYAARDNTGSVFPNDEQRPGRKDPDLQGSAVIDGVAYWVSAWIKNHEDDADYDPAKKTWTSLSFTPKNKQQAQRERPAQQERPARSAPPPPPPSRPASPPSLPTQPKDDYTPRPDEDDIPF